MTIKSEVQGVVQALFGAYAGGYLVELTAEATANGTGAVAARLASVQGIILGRDLTSNATFINTILGNLGVNSLNPAYAAAAKWATDALAGGATRADVVTSAVAFLEGIAAGTIVDAAYSDIAKAYAAKVAAGVTYSETAAGSKVLSVTALQTAAAAVTPTDVAGVLAEQTTAAADVASFLAGLDLNKDLVADGLATTYSQSAQADAVKAAPELAEAAVQALLTTANPSANAVLVAVTGGSATSYNIADPAATTANAAAIAANNALEDNAATLITAQLTAARVVKSAAITAAVANLVPGTTAAADDAAVKALIDSYLSAKEAAVAAGTAATNADIKAEAALDTWAANTTTATTPITTAGANDVVFTPAAGIANPAKVTVTFTVGTTPSVATYTAAGWTQPVVTSGVVLSAEVKAAAEAFFSASLNKLNADTAEGARFDAITTPGYTTPFVPVTVVLTSDPTDVPAVDEDGDPLVNEDGDPLFELTVPAVPAALAGNAATYAAKVEALTDHDKAVTAFTKALEAVTTARAMDAELTKLETAVTTATTKLTAAGYVLPTVTSGSVLLATSKSDLYSVAPLKSADASAGNTLSINDFGKAGDDALIVTGFKQATTAKGDNNVVEYFVKQVGADTVITFENKAYGLSDAAALEATVTLVGVDSTTLTFADGLIIG